MATANGHVVNNTPIDEDDLYVKRKSLLYTKADDSLPNSSDEDDPCLSEAEEFDEEGASSMDDGESSDASDHSSEQLLDEDEHEHGDDPLLLLDDDAYPGGYNNDHRGAGSGEASRSALESNASDLMMNWNGGQDKKREVPRAGTESYDDLFEEPPTWAVMGTMLSYFILFLVGYIRDFLRRIGVEKVIGAKDIDKHKDFVPLLSDFENFYLVNVVRRTHDCWKRPICSVPGAHTTIMDRYTPDGGFTYKLSGRKIKALNFSSYNYLGFAETSGPCVEAAKRSINEYGISPLASKQEFGNQTLQHRLERRVAEFVGAEDAVCFPMGFGTNSMNIPSLMGKGCLIISDELNHASLILGIKLSGATKRIFKHNDMDDLEKKLRDAIVFGQPRTRRPFKKILIMVEGVYSMEGTIVNLPKVIALAKRYKAYIWLDEAHSAGAMGRTGGGVVEYWGCNSRDVDILMGTFTKSFGSCGGYIAGNRKLVSYVRAQSHGSCYSCTMAPATIQMILSSMDVISGADGTTDGQDRIERLSRNSRYFRRKLRQKGFVVYGNEDSPVIPLLLYSFPMISKFSRDMLEKYGIATVTVAFPATPILLGRARFCISAAHSKDNIDQAIDSIDEFGDDVGIKFSKRKWYPNEEITY